LALCAEIEGLFVDLPPRPRERFTLVGCTPDGALADLLDRLPAEALGTEEARVGYIYVAAPPPPPGTSPSWFGEELDDVVVLAQRPNATMPGTVDIDLDGFVRLQDRTDEVERPDDVDEFVLKNGNESYGACRDITGVFREQAEPPVPRVRLIGCRPEALLLAALGQSTEAGLDSRRVYADVSEVAADGSVGRMTDAVVFGTVAAAEPSRVGAGLLDVTIDSFPREPLPAGVLDVLEQWRTGRPPRKNMWAGYDRQLRHHWCGVALSRRSGEPDRPPGTTYDLDGRFVTDVEGFYCAVGEAINGPGGTSAGTSWPSTTASAESSARGHRSDWCGTTRPSPASLLRRSPWSTSWRCSRSTTSKSTCVEPRTDANRDP
jgi:hypothetical protein